MIELVWPVAGMVSQWFGEDRCDYSRFGLIHHNGIDIAAPLGTVVLAAHDGQAWCYDDPGGYGQTIEIWSPGRSKGATVKTIYAHLQSFVTRDYGWVRAGQIIGTVGSTGNSTGPHCHFGLKPLWRNGRLARNPGYRDWVDPWPFVREA